MTLRRHFILYTSAGLLFGFAAQWVPPAFPQSAGAVLLGMGVTSMCGGLLALPIWSIATAFRVYGAAAWRGMAGGAGAQLIPGPAVVLAFVISFGALLGGAKLVMDRLWILPEAALARALFLLGLALGVALAGLGTLVLQRALAPALGWFDGRYGLPWPRWRGLRFLLFVVLPFAWLAFALTPHAAAFPPLGLALGLCAFLLLSRGLWHLGSWLSSRYKLLARVAGIYLVGWLVGCAALPVAFSYGAAAGRTAAAHPFSGPPTALLQWLTDIDGDGFSAWYGGTDCAPFNSSIHPIARDVPANKIDEDCDGKDATGGKGVSLERYSGAFAHRQSRYNVIWVILEAVRADYTSAISSKRRITPYLLRLARESLVYLEAYSQSSGTMLSLPSMFAGKNPGRMTWVKRRRRYLDLDASYTTIAERFRRAGYRTGLVSSGYARTRFPGLRRGFDWVRHTSIELAASGDRLFHAPAVMAHAFSFLMRQGSWDEVRTPFFLCLYMNDPHHQYFDHTQGFPSFGRGERARYAREIAYTDRFLGAFLESLRGKPSLWDDTVVVVTADHGEEFGEHGHRRHARTCYRESVHVPLIVRIPAVKAKRVTTPVALIDVVPTLIEVAGLDDGGDALDGQSLLVPALTPDKLIPERPVFCSVTKVGKYFRRGVRKGRWVLAHDVDRGRFELYDTVKDRAEQRDLIGTPAEEQVRPRLESDLKQSLTGNLAELLRGS